MRHRQTENLSFLDVLFILLFTFMCMFIIAFLSVNPKVPEQAKSSIELDDDYIILITWPLERNDDVDTYLKDPADKVIQYQQRTNGLMHLDRDDRGKDYDILTLPDGTKYKYVNNQEKASIRTAIKGEYILGVHMFRKDRTMQSITPVEITILSKRKDFKPWKKTVNLGQSGDEVTVTRFTVNDKGVIVKYSDLPYKFTDIIGRASDYDH